MSESKEGGGNSKKEDKVPHLTIFSDYDGFYVNQISNGCCSYMCENVCHCCESEQVYKITSTENKSKVIMFAHEDSSCCCRMFCGTSRPFDLFVHNGPDKTAPVILKMHRNWACAPGSCCCQQKMTVEDAVEKRYVGLSRIPWFCCHPGINVEDDTGNHTFKIHKDMCCGCCGGCCGKICCECCRSVEFDVEDKNGDEVGKVTKCFGGVIKEAMSDNDTFRIDFPKESTRKQRALLLGATLLLDINFFESNNDKVKKAKEMKAKRKKKQRK